MESRIQRVTCKVQETRRIHDFINWVSLTLQETRSIHDSMNIPKIEFIAYIYILFSNEEIVVRNPKSKIFVFIIYSL